MTISPAGVADAQRALDLVSEVMGRLHRDRVAVERDRNREQVRADRAVEALRNLAAAVDRQDAPATAIALQAATELLGEFA